MAGALEQALEQDCLDRIERQRLAVKPRSAIAAVESELTDHDLDRALAVAAARERANARRELRELERLSQEIIGARIEPTHAVLHVVERREDEHRRRGRAPAKGLEDLESRLAGQAQVEDEQVELGGLERAL